MAAPTDPFYLVKDDIQASLEKAQGQFARWQSLGKTNPERKQLQSDVEDECKSIAWQVDEMEKAVDVAERNMARFGLSQQEISSRKRWVQQTRRQCEGLASSMEAARASTSQTMTADSSATSRLGAAVHHENDRAIAAEGDRQQLLLRQQDSELDALGQHVQRIGQVGLQIHEELEEQGGMLDELQEDVEGTQTRLQQAQKKMAHVLKRAGLRGQLAILVVLLVLLVILLAFLFQ